MGGEAEYCRNCGTEIRSTVAECPECGEARASGDEKNMALAAFLSLLISGLGQAYAGEGGRGVAFFVGGIVFVVALMAIDQRLTMLGFLAPVTAAFDAAIQADAANRGR